MILNASAENGSLSSALRVTISFVSGFVPCTGGMSLGDGKKSTTASSSGCTPLFLNAVPQITGNSFSAITLLRSDFFSSSGVIVSPSMYLCNSSSSFSTMVSTI